MPTLSPASRAAWQEHVEGVCRRTVDRPRPAPDCKPPGHTTPCLERDFEAELRRCDGSLGCLSVAEQAHACRRCEVEVDAELVRARIEAASEDCAGLLRFAERPRSHIVDDLLDQAHTSAAIECLAKSKHPRARYLLARWRSDRAAAKILTGDPEATRAWWRHELSRALAGRGATFDGWVMWGAFDLLGAQADPLLPEVRALAVHPFPGEWERDFYVYEAIARLGARTDREAVPLLRTILADDTDWRAQMAAARSLGEIGVDAAKAMTALDDAARDHWNRDVRTMTAWAAARVRGEGPATPPTPKPLKSSDGMPPHDERCPLGLVHVDADDPRDRAWAWRQRWPWAVTVGGETITLPDPDRRAPTLPEGLPAIDLAARFPQVEGAGVSLADEVTAIAPLHRGWVIGTNMGEFGGSLWWLDRRGRARHLAGANVEDIVQLGGDHYALQGLAHLGSDQGSLLRIEDTPRGVQVHHALELPGSARAWWVRGDELWIGTFVGAFIVDADLHIRPAPCHAGERYPGKLDHEQVAPTIARVRPVVDRCLEALPPGDLPCGGALAPSVTLLLHIDAQGRVTEAKPFGDGWGASFPEVEACIAERAIGWRFPAPEGGAALLGYEFQRAGDSTELPLP